MGGFFRRRTFEEPALGRWTMRRGLWWAAYELPGHDEVIEVGVAGSKWGPDTEGLALALELPGRYGELTAPIGEALFEHYEPYIEGVEAGELMAAVPRIETPADVWRHVTLEWVRIEAPGREPVRIEIAYSTAWDIEHTLGARVRGWRLVELCGSII